MALHHYDGMGSRVGVTKTDEEVAAEGAGFVLLAAITLLGFPVLYVAYRAYQALTVVQAWHPLFAGLAALGVVGMAGCLLYRFAAVRFLYFGAETIGATLLTFGYVTDHSDKVWGSAAGLVVFVVLGGFTWWATTTNELR